MKHKVLVCILVPFVVISSCKKEDKKEDQWLIPKDEVKDGGPGKDGIPSVDEPSFTSPGQVAYLQDSELVVGFKSGGQVRAYPHPVLDWHEIVNDKFNGTPVAMTYCPLTGTAIAWDRRINGETTTFGVSGLLYNSNLIPYDRATESNWSQMKLLCVNGELIEKKAKTYKIVETTWGTWKAMYSNTEVLSENTGYNRDYESYPYGDYKDNNNLLFPVSNEDNRLHKKKRVYGIIIGGNAKAYRLSTFGGGIKVLQDKISDKPVVIVGSESKNFVVAYFRELNGDQLSFSSVSDSLPIIMKDGKRNRWNIWGEAVAGPDEGECLLKPTAYMGYWFAWAAFYPGISIYGK